MISLPTYFFSLQESRPSPTSSDMAVPLGQAHLLSSELLVTSALLLLSKMRCIFIFTVCSYSALSENICSFFSIFTVIWFAESRFFPFCLSWSLDGYGRRKGLTINTAQSEVVHFNSHGCNVLAFSVGGAPLANKDSFKYLGMVFYRTHNIAKSAEHMLGPFMDGCHRIRQFAREHQLNDRPHALLWLAKCYAIPTSMFACQIWGTRFMKQGSELDSPLQNAHLCFLKGVLSVKRSVPNWAVLRECGQEPLQFYWFRCCQVFQLSA